MSEDLMVRSEALRSAASAMRDVAQRASASADELNAMVSKLSEAMARTASAVTMQRFSAAWAEQFSRQMGDLQEVADRLVTAAEGYDRADTAAAANLVNPAPGL